MALPMAAMVFGCAPLDQMFRQLENRIPNRIPVMAEQKPASSSSIGKEQPKYEQTDNNTLSGRLVMKVRTDESAPPPCFVYQEPGTKGEIICTRLPWMDIGK